MNAHNEQQNIIAGALFDLMGYLTCREKKLCLSASDDAAPAVEALTEWAEKRGFDLDAARVTDWQAGLAAQPAAAQEAGLTFASFRAANVSRCEKWHPAGIGSWSPSDWLTAAMGELGELASEVKMHNRVRDGLTGNKEELSPDERRRRMANEAADVVTYLDLFCAERGIDLGDALIRKFNEVSERVGFPERLAAAPVTAAPGLTAAVAQAHGSVQWQPHAPTAALLRAREPAQRHAGRLRPRRVRGELCARTEGRSMTHNLQRNGGSRHG